MDTEKFMFYVVAFDPIKISTCLAPQNDHQHLGYVKEHGEKMTRYGLKMVKNSKVVSFESNKSIYPYKYFSLIFRLDR